MEQNVSLPTRSYILKVHSLRQAKAQEYGDNDVIARVWTDGDMRSPMKHTYPNKTITWKVGRCYPKFLESMQISIWEQDPVKDDLIDTRRFSPDKSKNATHFVVTEPEKPQLINFEGDGACYQMTYTLVEEAVNIAPIGGAYTMSEWKLIEKQAVKSWLMSEWMLQGRTILTERLPVGIRCVWSSLVNEFGGSESFRSIFYDEIDERIQQANGFPYGALRVNQHYVNSCGVAAMEVAQILLNPVRYVNIMCDIFTDGRFAGRSDWIEVSSDGLKKEYLFATHYKDTKSKKKKANKKSSSSQEKSNKKKKKKAVSTYSVDVAKSHWMMAMTVASYLGDNPLADETDIVYGTAAAIMPGEIEDLLDEFLLLERVKQYDTGLSDASFSCVCRDFRKLGTSKASIGFLNIDAVMVQDQDTTATKEFVHVVQDWSETDTKNFAEASDLFCEFPTTSLPPTDSTNKHAGFVKFAASPSKFSSDSILSDWNHFVVVLPIACEPPTNVPRVAWVNWSDAALDLAQLTQPFASPEFSIKNEEGMFFCCITWGKMKWIAASKKEVEEWFGGFTWGAA